MWDVETGARRRALWASSVPTFSKTQVSYNTISLDTYFGPGLEVIKLFSSSTQLSMIFQLLVIAQIY